MKTTILTALLLLATSAHAQKNPQITDGSFKLYEEPHFQPSAFCDLHTQLNIANVKQAPNYGVAQLEQKLLGFCKIGVNANPRTYFITAKDAGCGSKQYSGYRENLETNHWDRIEITDHRTRLCKDLVPARIIVSESTAHSEDFLYSIR